MAVPEYRLKTGETVEGILDLEDENYVYLVNALWRHNDGSTTFYARVWIAKQDIVAPEPAGEKPAAEGEGGEAPEARTTRRRR